MRQDETGAATPPYPEWEYLSYEKEIVETHGKVHIVATMTKSGWSDAAVQAHGERLAACYQAMMDVSDPLEFMDAVTSGHCGQHPTDCELCEIVGEAIK